MAAAPNGYKATHAAPAEAATAAQPAAATEVSLFMSAMSIATIET